MTATQKTLFTLGICLGAIPWGAITNSLLGTLIQLIGLGIMVGLNFIYDYQS